MTCSLLLFLAPAAIRRHCLSIQREANIGSGAWFLVSSHFLACFGLSLPLRKSQEAEEHLGSSPFVSFVRLHHAVFVSASMTRSFLKRMVLSFVAAHFGCDEIVFVCYRWPSTHRPFEMCSPTLKLGCEAHLGLMRWHQQRHQ